MLFNKTNKIKLSGITKKTITTYGSCIIDIYGHPVEFHVVKLLPHPNSFLIPHGGILGANFFKNSIKINFFEKILSWKEIIIPFVGVEEKTITGRTYDVVKIKVINDKVKTDYTPSLKLERWYLRR